MLQLALNHILSPTQMSSVERIFDLPNGVSLDTTVVIPRSNASSQQSQSQKLAVFCHPWSWLGGRKEDPVLHALVNPFLERGYHVVLFNSRGVGKSTKWPSLSALSEAEDLGKLIKVLVKHISEKGSAITQVVLMGYSHGSIPVSHHPTSIQDLSPAITVCHILLSYPLSPMAFLTVFHHNTHAAVLQRLVSNESARVLVVYGDHDEFTAEGKYDTWSQGLIAGGRKVDIHKVKDANHFWHGQSMSSLLDIVSNWLDLL